MPAKHLMVSVGEELSCKDGIKFVSNFFHNKEDMKITLFCVAPVHSQATSQTLIAGAWENDDKSPHNDKKSTDPLKATLKSCSDYLLRNGFDKSNIIQKVIAKRNSTVQDIIHNVEAGLFDALVLGKRSSSFLQDVVTGSVSSDILSKSIEFPLWICREPDLDRKNILLCAEESDSCLRASDHVSYILQDQDAHGVTILHIDQGDNVDQQPLFDKIIARMQENGVAKERITTKIIKGKRVHKVINKEIDQHEYAAIALGWTGKHVGGLSKIFHDSSSQELLKDLHKTALWVTK